MKTQKDCLESKIYIDALIIVEGNSDKSRLSSFVDTDILVSNGLMSCKDDIEFIKEVSKRRKIIIFTDPDNAGEEIRKKLNSIVEEAINVYVPEGAHFNGKKHGVAECDKETLVSLLKPHESQKTIKNNGLLMEDLYNLKIVGLDESSNIKERICKHYSLGKCNSKTLLKRLNILKIEKEDLKEYLKSGN